MKRLLATALSVFIAALVVCAPAADAAAAGHVGIAAIVNEEAITLSDLSMRVKLYTSGTPEAPPENVRLQIEQQVLNKLIDEKLQLQEAAHLGVVVGENQISDGFASIAKQNGLESEAFKKHLADAGVSPGTLNDQIRAEIAWSQVVRRKLRPDVTVSEGEIDNEMDQLVRGQGKTEFHVAEIFLAVTSADAEAAVREESEKLARQITGGARFSEVAREFSQSPGAAQGGELGWVRQDQTDPKLAEALAKIQPGQISPPVRTDKGYHILFLREIRQAGLPAAAGQADKADEKFRENVANTIGMKRLDQMQERYLRDLRATAYIDKRI